jgi:hypothetical protein
MNRFLFITLLFLSLTHVGCNKHRGHKISTTVTASGNKTEAELIGDGAKGTVAGDELEIKNGSIFVNGISFGFVSNSFTVNYLVLPSGRTLSVDGTQRNPVKQ